MVKVKGKFIVRQLSVLAIGNIFLFNNLFKEMEIYWLEKNKWQLIGEIIENSLAYCRVINVRKKIIEMRKILSFIIKN